MSAKTITRAYLSEAVYQEVGLSRNEFGGSAGVGPERDHQGARRRRHGEAILVRQFLHPPEGAADRAQSQDWRGGADPAAPCSGVPSVAGTEDPDQRRAARERGQVMLPSTSPDHVASRGSFKSAAAFRTIAEVASELELPAHVLRFWESKFPQIKPLKRRGGRRYYRPEDVSLASADPQPPLYGRLHHKGRAAAATGGRQRSRRKSPRTRRRPCPNKRRQSGARQRPGRMRKPERSSCAPYSTSYRR